MPAAVYNFDEANDILYVSFFTPSASEIMPIASVSAMPAGLSPQPEPA